MHRRIAVTVGRSPSVRPRGCWLYRLPRAITDRSNGKQAETMIIGIHHLGLTVRDVEASALGYECVLGFRRSGMFDAPDGAHRKVFLRHSALQIRLGLTQHRSSGGEPVDEIRTGWTIWHSMSRVGPIWLYGPEGSQPRVSLIPRLRRPTPFQAPRYLSSATWTTSSWSCSPTLEPATSRARPITGLSDAKPTIGPAPLHLEARACVDHSRSCSCEAVPGVTDAVVKRLVTSCESAAYGAQEPQHRPPKRPSGQHGPWPAS
jgi:hypothetical protein